MRPVHHNSELTRVAERYSVSVTFWSIFISQMKKENLKRFSTLSVYYVGTIILLNGAELPSEANSCLASL
jgi:hypothetical protein